MLQFLLFTGVRKGEMAHLHWDDIDFDNRLIHIQPKKDWNPKSGKPRSILINKPALEARLEAKKAHLKSGRRSQLVFPGRKGCIGDISDGLNHACDRAGIPRVTVHQLRQTCASQMVMSGADLGSVAAVLGHKDITTTMIYTHLTQGHVRTQMEKLNAIPLPEICPKSAPKDISVEERQKKGTRMKPDSLSDSEWCRMRDLNPHGFPPPQGNSGLNDSAKGRHFKLLPYWPPRGPLRPHDAGGVSSDQGAGGSNPSGRANYLRGLVILIAYKRQRAGARSEDKRRYIQISKRMQQGAGAYKKHVYKKYDGDRFNL